MRPIDLYSVEPQKTSRDISILHHGGYYSHIKELDIDLYDLNDYGKNVLNNEKIEIKYYKYHNFDGRRFWALASVWFEDKPIMIIQNAGREGDDFSKRFVTDKYAFNNMLDYIKSLADKNEIDDDLYEEDSEIDNLDNFYNYSLNGHFDYWY